MGHYYGLASESFVRYSGRLRRDLYAIGNGGGTSGGSGEMVERKPRRERRADGRLGNRRTYIRIRRLSLPSRHARSLLRSAPDFRLPSPLRSTDWAHLASLFGRPHCPVFALRHTCRHSNAPKRQMHFFGSTPGLRTYTCSNYAIPATAASSRAHAAPDGRHQSLPSPDAPRTMRPKSGIAKWRTQSVKLASHSKQQQLPPRSVRNRKQARTGNGKQTLTPAAKTGIATRGTLPSVSLNISLAVIK